MPGAAEYAQALSGSGRLAGHRRGGATPGPLAAKLAATRASAAAVGSRQAAPFTIGWGGPPVTKDARDDRRRAAYAAFIATQEELRRVILAWKTADPPAAADSQFGPAVAQAVGSVDRAFVAVTLAGPEKAQDHADDVRGKAWGVYNVIYRPESPGQPVMPKFAERVGDYIDACDQFAQTASEVLHTR